MAKLSIDIDKSITIDFTVRESDIHSKLIYFRIDKQLHPEEIHGCNEMLLTPTQAELLGRFLARQADEIRTEQSFRKEPK